jgi:hypothetical protein
MGHRARVCTPKVNIGMTKGTLLAFRRRRLVRQATMKQVVEEVRSSVTSMLKIPDPVAQSGQVVLMVACSLVGVFSSSEPLVSVTDASWLVQPGGRQLTFTLRDGRFDSITPVAPTS